MADFNNIDIHIDTANSVIPPIRLHAGDVDGRTLRFIITDDGAKIASSQYAVYSAELQWNGSPDDPNSAGGFASFAGYYTLEDTLAFVMPVPRALLQDTGSRALLTFVLKRTDEGDPTTNFTVCSRNIVALVEPSVLKASAPAIMDPLKELHDAEQTAQDAAANAQKAVADAQSVIDGASISAGTTTTLKPNQPASSELSGTGLSRTLNLGIPRGAGIASITATTATGSTPTVATETNADGDITVSLGIPRGEKGDSGQPGQPGPKGDPGDASTIASSTVAGVVKVGSGLAITEDGTLSASAQPVPPATAEQAGIVKPGKGLAVNDGTLNVNIGSGLEFDADGALGVKTGSGLSFGTVGNGDFLQVDPATADAIGGVKVGAGLSVDAQGVLSASASGAQVFVAMSSQDESTAMVGKLTVPSPTATFFLLELSGFTSADDSSSELVFPQAISFTINAASVNAWCTYPDSEKVNISSTFSLKVGSSPNILLVHSIFASQRFASFGPKLVPNRNAATASTVADAADDATPAPAELSCTIDWSRLK